MLDQEISKVLIKRIFANIGLGTKNSVFDTKNILNKRLKIQEEDDSVKEYDIFAAECSCIDSALKAVVTNIGTDLNPDFVLFFITSDTVISLRYLFKDYDSGIFLVRWDEKWIDMSVLERLNLTAAIELITQNGYMWLPVTDSEKAFDIVSNFLSEEQ